MEYGCASLVQRGVSQEEELLGKVHWEQLG